MAFIRPRVEVFQEFKSTIVAPAVQEFNVCLVGPCFDIKDYAEDKTELFVSEFIKAGYTKDAPCDATGSSSGRPDVGTFLTLSEPPALRAGAKVDKDSVYAYLDECLIEVAKGTNAAYNKQEETPSLNVSTANVSAVVPGDRVIMTIAGGTAVSYVRQVNVVGGNNIIILTSEPFTSSQTNVLWRVEHQLSDVVLPQSVLVINQNEISFVVPSTGIQITYLNSAFLANYGKIYLEYRALRTDLTHLTTINTTDEITSNLGTIDERNPLAVGAYVALSNAGTPIMVYGVNADSLTGHTDAKNYLSSRQDIYAIVPLTDSLNADDWLSVVNMWRQDCENLALPEKSNFRIVLGSYHELPQYKNSVTPSTTGSTYSLEGAAIDVFITDQTAPEFSSAVTYKNTLLDLYGDSSHRTFDNRNPFASNYSGAKLVSGAIGRHRLRLSSAFGTSMNTTASDYIVRTPLTVAEGAQALAQNVTNVQAAASAGKLALTSDAFSTYGVSVGDIIQVTDATVIKQEAYLVSSIVGNTVTTTATYTGSSGSVTVNIYRLPSIATGYFNNASQFTITSGTVPTGYGAGDVIISFCSTADPSGSEQNIGLFVIEEINGSVITLETVQSLTNEDPELGPFHSLVFIHPINAAGNMGAALRARLTHLSDVNAQFLTTVEPGEYIEIPYPPDTPGIWDTTVNRWEIDTIVSNTVLKAKLGDLEELAPKNLFLGFSGDCPYRIAIGLDKSSQIEELNNIIKSYKSMRLVMCWPHQVKVSGVLNNKTSEQNFLRGQYLACAVGGQVASQPPQQGFTFIPITAITELSGSSFYFTDDQLTTLRNGGWYVFVQDTEVSPPYSIHEVTTNVSSYEFGELMHVKDFDYVSINMKNVLEEFKGRYNITPLTLDLIRASLEARITYLKNRSLSRIGAPLLSASIGLVEQTEADRLEIYMLVELPHVLNQIGLHLAV